MAKFDNRVGWREEYHAELEPDHTVMDIITGLCKADTNG